MSTAPLPFTMPKPVRRKVRLLRWLVRSYVCLDGFAAVALVLGLAFWLGLGIDWVFEPAPAVRGALWGLTGLAATYAALRYLFGPLGAKLSNANLALLLERNFPQLNQSVITTVEAADRRRDAPIGNEVLLLNTSQQAATALRGLKLRPIFQWGPLLWKTGVAVTLGLSIFVFAATQTETFSFWLQRMQLDNRLWPRQVALRVLGFQQVEGQHRVNVARDDDFELQVEASIRNEHQAPEQVEIRYRLADGRRGRDAMTRIGEAIPGRDDAQLYRYQFKKVAADLHFDVVGGDDRLRNLQLRVVERPQIFRMLLECEFPTYLERTPQTIPVSGRVELPEGTHALCRIEANKPLATVHVHDPAGQADLPVQLAATDDRQVSFPVAVGQSDRVLLVTMHDQDGVTNREPYRIVLSAVPDQPPEVSVQLRGIGTAVTPQAKIPFAGQVIDEYGLETTWFSYQIATDLSTKDSAPPAERATTNQPQGSRELSDLGSFDLALPDPVTKHPLVAVEPGQQLTLSVKARDAYNLNEQEHVGSSQRFLLDVVTSSQLRALLEKKELALRQRFESIYEKMTGTRQLLDRIDVSQRQEAATDPDATRSSERDRLRLSGALQNVVQLSYETLGVANGFEEIVSELTNNRVDTEELTERLRQGIAEPLREIGSELMPQLEKSLQQLQAAAEPSNAGNSSAAEKILAMSQAEGDLVLDAMQQVLNRMLELESYNELVELLRGIAAEHQQLLEETKQKRRAKLRSLLED